MEISKNDWLYNQKWFTHSNVVKFWLIQIWKVTEKKPAISSIVHNNLGESEIFVPAIERPGLESQRSRKRLFSTERFSNSWNIVHNIKEFENLSVEKKTLLTALGLEPRSFDYWSTALTTSVANTRSEIMVRLHNYGTVWQRC